jgi:hypothetical protein
MEGVRDVVPEKLEVLVVEEMGDVAARPREEVVDAKHLTIIVEKPLA